MGLLAKMSEDSSGLEVAKQMLEKINWLTSTDEGKAKFASIKNILEQFADSEDSFVFGRIKAPFSASKKFAEDKKYQTSWNRIKDLLAFTVVVKGNNDKVDETREKIVDYFSDKKNPYSESIYEDFTRTCCRKDKNIVKQYVYQDPQGRFYQTNDGYKNVKVNIMLDEFPIEIQIKTWQQLLAHYATHDSVYKAPPHIFGDVGEREREFLQNKIADKLFPFFEMTAYLKLCKDQLSEEEKIKVQSDLREICSRNFEDYNKYFSIFNEAKADFAVYAYKFLHKEDFVKEISNENIEISTDPSVFEIKKVYKYTLKQIKMENPSLKPQQQIDKAMDTLIEMPFNQFISTKESIKDGYRLGTCAIIGCFDGITRKTVETFKFLNSIFRDIYVNVYEDDFISALTGKTPLFSLNQRLNQISNCKYVTSAEEIQNWDNKPVVGLSQDELLFEEDKKPYDLIVIGGVFDGLTPGHTSHIKQIVPLSDNIYAMVKSDEYVERVKHKTTINNEEDRKSVVEGQRGITKAFITNNDILPVNEVVEEMQKLAIEGKRCAIVVGSDWYNPNKLQTKPQSSLEEKQILDLMLPNVDLLATIRPGVEIINAEETGIKLIATTEEQESSVMSSTTLRDSLLEKKQEDMSLNEVKELGGNFFDNVQ